MRERCRKPTRGKLRLDATTARASWSRCPAATRRALRRSSSFRRAPFPGSARSPLRQSFCRLRQPAFVYHSIMEKPRDERILFLFRHGETDWNREGRLQGHTDTLLNATGLAQAQALADSLRPHRLDAVVSSDLARAQTTAQIVAEALRVPLFIEAGLRETDVGAAEGLLWAEAKARFG